MIDSQSGLVPTVVGGSEKPLGGSTLIRSVNLTQSLPYMPILGLSAKIADQDGQSLTKSIYALEELGFDGPGDLSPSPVAFNVCCPKPVHDRRPKWGEGVTEIGSGLNGGRSIALRMAVIWRV